MDLTIKQEKFCNSYIETGSASQSYRVAYDCKNMSDESVNVNASKLLNDTKITLRVKQLKAELKDRSDITKDRILSELQTVLNAKITDYLSFDGKQVTFKDFSTLTDAQIKAIESVKETRNGIELKLHGKSWSIDRLCKMLGYDQPIKADLNIHTPLNIQVLNEEAKTELEKLAERLRGE